MQRINEILTELCNIPAVSGEEHGAKGLIAKLRQISDGVTQLSGGSIIAIKRCGKPNAKKILIDAHLDQIGLIVTKIDKNGFVHFCNHAGVDKKILPATEVTILGKTPVDGVISAKPPHLLSKEERDKPVKIEDMVIDVGLSVTEIGDSVRVGDLIALKGSTLKMLNHCITGRSLDNRAGCAVLLSMLEVMQNRTASADIYFVFSAGEEFGGYGAAAAALEIQPDEAIVIDVSHADMPSSRKGDCVNLGDGAEIGYSPILDQTMCEQFSRLARDKKIPCQAHAMSGRTYTNADNIMPLCGGIPTTLISIPLRYMHTPQEVISLEDLVSARALLMAYLYREDM